MGLNASSDEWCCQSDVLIRGIPWAKKILDGTLIWAEDMDQLMERTRIILGRCREYNITISKKKLELGSKINFAGHIISVSTTGTTDIAMLDSTRIIVPPNAIQSIMKELHRAHSGIEKMYKTAVQLYFWPGMKNTIKQAVDS